MDRREAVGKYVRASIPGEGDEAERVRRELVGHILEAVDSRLAEGKSEAEALEMALKELGSLDSVRLWARKSSRQTAMAAVLDALTTSRSWSATWAAAAMRLLIGGFLVWLAAYSILYEPLKALALGAPGILFLVLGVRSARQAIHPEK